jgi:hypothetical protein
VGGYLPEADSGGFLAAEKPLSAGTIVISDACW